MASCLRLGLLEHFPGLVVGQVGTNVLYVLDAPDGGDLAAAGEQLVQVKSHAAVEDGRAARRAGVSWRAGRRTGRSRHRSPHRDRQRR